MQYKSFPIVGHRNRVHGGSGSRVARWRPTSGSMARRTAAPSCPLAGSPTRTAWWPPAGDERRDLYCGHEAATGNAMWKTHPMKNVLSDFSVDAYIYNMWVLSRQNYICTELHNSPTLYGLPGDAWKLHGIFRVATSPDTAPQLRHSLAIDGIIVNRRRFSCGVFSPW